MKYVGYKDYWDKKRRKIDMMRKSGESFIYVKKTRISVICEFDPEFAESAPKIGGRWRFRTGQWSFPIERIGQVKALICKIYGENKVTVIAGGEAKNG